MFLGVVVFYIQHNALIIEIMYAWETSETTHHFSCIWKAHLLRSSIQNPVASCKVSGQGSSEIITAIISFS